MRFDGMEDLLGELGILKIAGREIDGDADLPSLIPPGSTLVERGVENPEGQRFDQPRLLRDRDELIRRDDPEIGTTPADQRFDTDHPACLQIDLRLIEQKELILLN